MSRVRDAPDWLTDKAAFRHDPHDAESRAVSEWNEPSSLIAAVIKPKASRDQPDLGGHARFSQLSAPSGVFGLAKVRWTQSGLPSGASQRRDDWPLSHHAKAQALYTQLGLHTLPTELSLMPTIGVSRARHGALAPGLINAAMSAFRAKLVAALQEPSIGDATTPSPPSELASLVRPPLSRHERASLLVSAAVKSAVAENELILESAPVEVVATMFSLPGQLLVDLAASRRVLAFPYQDTLLFPLWQFDPGTGDHLVPNLSEVLAILKDRTADEIVDWLRTPKRRLDGESPIRALRTEQHALVLSMARALGAS